MSWVGDLMLFDHRRSAMCSPAIARQQAAADRFIHTDWLGSTRYVTDITGTAAGVMAAQRYDAYGRRDWQMPNNPNQPTDLQWAGAWGYQTEFSNTPPAPGLGLDYMQQRYYDPVVGRFASPDPIGFAGGMNLYEYAEDDPVGGVDPSGLLAVIKAVGNDVTIYLPVEYGGPAADQHLERVFSRGIEDYWSGKIGKYTVHTHVVAPDRFPCLAGHNFVDIVHGPGDAGGHKHPYTLLHRNFSVFFGRPEAWARLLPAREYLWYMAAHESGHLMGLPDHYSEGAKGNSVTLPGYRGEIMGSLFGRPIESDITEILGDPGNVVNPGWLQ